MIISSINYGWNENNKPLVSADVDGTSDDFISSSCISDIGLRDSLFSSLSISDVGLSLIEISSADRL